MAAVDMDASAHDGERNLDIKPSTYAPANGVDSGDDTQHSRRRYLDTQSIHGDTVIASFLLPALAAAFLHAGGTKARNCKPLRLKSALSLLATFLSWCRLPAGELLPSSCSLPASVTCGDASASSEYGTCRCDSRRCTYAAMAWAYCSNMLCRPYASRPRGWAWSSWQIALPSIHPSHRPRSLRPPRVQVSDPTCCDYDKRTPL
jgi:hypothetical protein